MRQKTFPRIPLLMKELYPQKSIYANPSIFTKILFIIIDELVKSQNWDVKVPVFRLFKIKAIEPCLQ